jgi:TM2 domain-containing membrane protein YozV
MTTAPEVGIPAPTPRSSAGELSADHRGSWLPTWAMIATRFMELRKRRGLMIALIVVNIGIPTIFLAIRLLLHAFAPKSYGPAGGYDIYTGLTAGVMYVFGFIVAATLGSTAGSVDLTEGMFRHLVVTGRSRLAVYLARIPAGLAIIVPLLAIGFAVVCAVCVFAAPTSINYDGARVPPHLSLAGFENWAGQNPDVAICDLPYNGPITVDLPCGPAPGSNGGPTINGSPAGGNVQSTPAAITAQAVQIARQDYSEYKTLFLYPSVSLMIETGLWILLEATIGFIVGLGLASLLGQRTVAVVLMIVLEIVLTPIFSRARIPHLSNLQRAVVGLATAHLAPGGLPVLGGGGGGPGGGHGSPRLLPESTTVAVCVILAWLVGWTILGAWRMMTRDA